MTCNECIHQELCDFYAKLGLTDIPADDVTPCDLFKRKFDVVEVVRCRNCKYFNNQFNICKQLSPRDYVVMNEDDFCSYGERK